LKRAAFGEEPLAVEWRKFRRCGEGWDAVGLDFGDGAGFEGRAPVAVTLVVIGNEL